MFAAALPGGESADLLPAGAAIAPAPVMLALQRAMSFAGWEVDHVDVDLTRAHPVATIKCHRADGRWLWAKVDALGRCTVETFHRERWLGMPQNSKGNWPLSTQIDDVFLGRSRPASPRALLDKVATYIADNSVRPVSLPEMQAAWDALMGAPARPVPAELAA